VATELADLSDEVAHRLESGDPCGARDIAARLRESVTDAINEQQVPELYLEELSGVVNEIEAQIPGCEPPAPPAGDGGGDDDEEEEEEEEDD
jgi:hypothetical protein